MMDLPLNIDFSGKVVVITGAGGAESVELLKTGPVHIGDDVLKVHY